MSKKHVHAEKPTPLEVALNVETKLRAPGYPLDNYSVDDLMEMVIEEIFPDFEWDDSARDTAGRFIAYLREYRPTPKPFNTTVFPHHGDQLIMCAPVEFSSMCKHHLLPYLGHAWAGYISNGEIIGLSKIPRVIKWLATKPSTQEQLTTDIAKWLDVTLKPKGVMVVVKSKHTCMSCRGVRETDAQMITSLPLGVFLSVPGARDEFLMNVNGK